MAINPGNEIRRLFARAVLQHEAARNLDGEGWAAYRKIQDDHAALVRFENRQFELEYQTRFEVAQRRIIDQGGTKSKTLKHRWFGSDRFNRAAIERQADRDVRHAHNQLLARLDYRKEAALDAVFATDEYRETMREKIKTDFSKAVDRRSGPDRRRGPPR